MPPPALDDLLQRLRRLDYTRNRMEKLFKDNKITKRDLDSVYESLFIRAVTSFEVFLQDHFMAILGGKVQYKRERKVAVRMTAVSSSALLDILLGGRPYLTWLPFKEHTQDRAMIFLKDGRPFSDVPIADRNTMNNITTIRNAIAHESLHAMKQFEKKVIGQLPLLPGERKPAGFLRSQLRPTQSRFEFYVAELGRIATALC
jgi:hypothetical protein